MTDYKDKWWYSTPTILILSAFSFLIVPLFAAVGLLIVQIIKRNKFVESLQRHKLYVLPISEKEKIINELDETIADKEKKISDNDILLKDQGEFIESLRKDFNESVEKERKNIIQIANTEAKQIADKASEELNILVQKVTEYQEDMGSLTVEKEKLIKEVERYKRQARNYKSEVVGLKNFGERFPHSINFENVNQAIEQLTNELDEDKLLGTVLRLHLHSDNSKELRKLVTATNKEIQNVLSKYEDRYSTKSNRTIYHLMVIGLQAEMQILLSQLKFNNIEESRQAIKEIITKYLAICGDGNQSILPTVTKFLTEIEPLYHELVEIEYKYYVYREQEREEQRLIKEQMKQEAAERKQLAEEKKKLEKEEEKFNVEITRNQLLLEQETDSEKVRQLEARLKELESQVKEIEGKKEEISSLALGKAGYVYVISNLGSFGDQMFKIGMTRRMNPQDRIDELGDASVPFKFDVHAMIFSNDAVGLETKLHQILNNQRVNKVNYRKEFFRTDIEAIRNIVEEVDPTVEFITTMIAEEYKQTKALEEAELVS